MIKLTLALVSSLSLVALVGCSDDPPPQEPVAAEATPAVPDAPGETQPKPAGEGSATPEAAPPPVETSTSPAPAAATPAPEPGEMVVNVSHLNVRSGAGMSHAVVRVIKQGDRVKPTTCKGGWCQIGPTEFVGRKHLSDAVK